MSQKQATHSEFARMLMKCQAMDLHRHEKFRREIHDFVVQAIKDSQYLVEGKIPPDISALKIEAVKARRSAD